jgi:hypothetical protein
MIRGEREPITEEQMPGDTDDGRVKLYQFSLATAKDLSVLSNTASRALIYY